MTTQGLRLNKRFALFLQQIFFGSMSALMSNHVKRMIFITSLYCYVERLDSLREEALVKLNRAMPMARSGNALRFPAAMRNIVWGDTQVESVLDHHLLKEDIPDQLVALKAEEIVNLTPRWIRYPRNSMIRDTQLLIKRGSYLAAA
jgi:hypothetical protein